MKPTDTENTFLNPTVPLHVLPPGTLFTVSPGSVTSARPRSGSFVRLPHCQIGHLIGAMALSEAHDSDGAAGYLSYLPAQTPVRPLVGGRTRPTHGPASIRHGGAAAAVSDDDELQIERGIMQTGVPSLAAELEEDARLRQ